MATNRKKGSASLFELIDKSGAKSGRHSGSGMKTPAWLDKYNHPHATDSNASDSKKTEAAGNLPNTAPASNGPSTAANGQATTSGEIKASADREPAAAASAAKPALGQVYHAPANVSAAEPFRSVTRGNLENPVLLDVLVAKFRPWLLFALFIVIFVLIAGLIILATRRSSGSDSDGSRVAGSNSRISIPPGIDSDGSQNISVPAQPRQNNDNPSVPTGLVPVNPVVVRHRPAALHVGKVLPTAEVPRLADHWYLVILTTLPQYARPAAQFIAQHGVSVTIEHGANNLAQVTSVRGFVHRGGPRAMAFRRKVIDIGRLLPGVKRKHDSVWGDAYFVQIVRTH